MWCRAELSCRLPPLLSRCRLVLPWRRGWGRRRRAWQTRPRCGCVRGCPRRRGQGHGGHRAGAVDAKQRAGVLLQDESHAPLQQIRLLLEGLPCLARDLQRNEHALLHHVPARTAYGEPAHPDRGVRPAVAFPDVFRGGGQQARRGIGQCGHRRDQLRPFCVQGA